MTEGEPCSGLTMTFNPTFLPGSRDPSTESVTSLISTSTGNSISPQTTWRQAAPTGVASLQRPHSITGRKSGLVQADICVTKHLVDVFCDSI